MELGFPVRDRRRELFELLKKYVLERERMEVGRGDGGGGFDDDKMVETKQ